MSSAPQRLRLREEELVFEGGPVELVERLRGLAPLFLLDGGEESQSFVAFCPEVPQVLRLPVEAQGPERHGALRQAGDALFGALRGILARHQVDPHPHWAFTGGLVGWFGYDLRLALEAVSCRAQRDFDLPDAAWWSCRQLIARDPSGRCALLTLEGERGEPAGLLPRDAILQALAAPAPKPGRFHCGPLKAPDLEAYAPGFAAVQEHLHAGRSYQVNLARRFEVPVEGDPLALYSRLRALNPAAFGAYVEFEGEALISVSPERFLRVAGDRVETRPIKGTAPRGATPAEDEALAQGLLASEKDRAELAMIVDVMRNDLARVCRPGSVRVEEALVLESHPTVHHLVARIVGRLEEERDVLDLCRAALPGGSITGAPRVSSMEIIDSLEPCRRGPYTGSLGYLGFDGRADLDILIRTGLWSRGRLLFHGGGGLTVDSKLRAEFVETRHKVRAFLEACGVEES